MWQLGIQRMVAYKKILFFILFAGISISAGAETLESTVNESITDHQRKETTLKIVINYNTEILLENAPTTGYLEVYSVLGAKITSVNLKSCTDGECSLLLKKGLYIIKAGKVAQKIIVR